MVELETYLERASPDEIVRYIAELALSKDIDSLSTLQKLQCSTLKAQIEKEIENEWWVSFKFDSAPLSCFSVAVNYP